MTLVVLWLTVFFLYPFIFRLTYQFFFLSLNIVRDRYETIYNWVTSCNGKNASLKLVRKLRRSYSEMTRLTSQHFSDLSKSFKKSDSVDNIKSFKVDHYRRVDKNVSIVRDVIENSTTNWYDLVNDNEASQKHYCNEFCVKDSKTLILKTQLTRNHRII